MTKKYLTIPAVVAGALGLGAGAVRAAEPTTEQLMQQIEQLHAKVQQLESQQQALNARDVDATLERVLRDADRRSQLLQMEGFTAGYNKGKFVIQDAQGNWLLNPFFQFQFRSVTTYCDSEDEDNSDTQHGFEVRRMRFGVTGNAISPELTYMFRWEANRNGGGVSLELAYITYFFNDDMAVKLGQWKENVFHEATMADSRQLAAERSLVDSILGGGLTAYCQGVALIYAPKDQPFRVEAALTDGLSTLNTDFQEHGGGAAGIAPNWGVTGRVEYKVMGDWKAYDDFTAMGTKEDLLVIGGGVDYTQDGDAFIVPHTVDVQWESGSTPLGVYAAYVGNHLDLGGDTDSTYNWGALVQAGYMLNEQWEVFGRYDYIKLDEDIAGDDDSFNEITLGVNYFINGHGAKVTVDVIWLPDGSPSDVTGSGVLANTDDEFILRGQFQLLL